MLARESKRLQGDFFALQCCPGRICFYVNQLTRNERDREI